MAKCTGLAATWCPIHGDCTCPRNELGEPVDWHDNERAGLNAPHCPLHADTSTHGDDRPRT